MVKKWTNLNLPGALHFITGNVINRVRTFSNDTACRAFIDVCADLLQRWPAKLIAYVLMPDHVHLIVNPKDGDVRGFSGALKSLSAKSIIDATGRQAVPARDSRSRRVVASGMAGEF